MIPPPRPDDAQTPPSLGLTAQFALMGAVVLVLGMGTIGYWVGERIASSVTRNTAVATAFYVDRVIAPLTLDLPKTGELGEGPALALRETLSEGSLRGRLSSFKLWSPDGTVVFATDPAIIGKRFPLKPDLQEALGGQVHGEFDSLDDEENAAERQAGIPLLEIYSPVREPWSGRVIGVAEFYERAGELQAEIRAARLRSWLVVGAVTLVMLALLSTIVVGGSRTIRRQRDALQRRFQELSRALSQNEALRRRVQAASRRNATLAERGLRRISADLHDGPAQLLAFALLRLNAATATLPPTEDLSAVRDALAQAMQEVRAISGGAALPELDGLATADILAKAVKAHEARTGTTVDLHAATNLPLLRQAERICVYRFVQEGLNNAARHGGAVSQTVAATVESGELILVVSDGGPGFDAGTRSQNGLGLAGLAERVAALDGRFDIQSGPGSGTTLTMRLPLTAETDAAT